MELISTILLILAAVAIIAYGIVTETADWVGRAEIIERRWPRAWIFMSNRPLRLLLIFIALVMLARVVQELHAGAEVPEVKLSAPKVPEVQAAVKEEPENPNSLRRRTMKLADELSTFLADRAQNHPPYAYPDSSDPNPSDERKAAIKKCQQYDQQTQDTYARLYRDRLVGLIREYHAKGISTGWLESSAMQRPPMTAMPGAAIEGTPNDELWQLRNLAYHIAAKDNAIFIPE